MYGARFRLMVLRTGFLDKRMTPSLDQRRLLLKRRSHRSLKSIVKKPWFDVYSKSRSIALVIKCGSAKVVVSVRLVSLELYQPWFVIWNPNFSVIQPLASFEVQV